jgi:exopolysaccharide production protein ExoZ
MSNAVPSSPEQVGEQVRSSGTLSGSCAAGVSGYAECSMSGHVAAGNRVKSERKVFASLQAGRGIAAVAVVVHHAADYFGDPRFWADSWYPRHFDFGAFGVEFFFVLSGIVILLAHWKDQGEVNSFRSYAVRRLRRIYPVYWIVLAAAITTLQFKPMLGAGFERDGWVILSSILLVHLGSLETIIHVAWTLFHEMMFYVLFSAVILSRIFGYSLLGLWFAASALMLVIPFGGPFLQEYLSPLHLLFVLGMLIAVLIRREVRLQAGLFLAWMNFLGDASYSIYLVHFPLLSLTARVCFLFSQRVTIPVWALLTLQVLFAVAAGISFHLGIEKPLLRQFSSKGMKKAIPMVE